MNAKGPINTALTMDLITTEMRGRWSSIQSIAGFSWSGSAFIGGWLAHSYGYRFSFFVTAMVYIASGLMYFSLVWVFPKDSTEDDIAASPAVKLSKAVDPAIQCASPASNLSSVLHEAEVPPLEHQLLRFGEAHVQADTCAEVADA